MVFWQKLWRDRSGPKVARAFQVALGLCVVSAFLSLGAQIDVLIGSRGLLPIADVARNLATRDDVFFWSFPTIFRYWPMDWVLNGGIILGGLLGYHSGVRFRGKHKEIKGLLSFSVVGLDPIPGTFLGTFL